MFDYLNKLGLSHAINKIKEKLEKLEGVELTKAEYDALSEEERNNGDYYTFDSTSDTKGTYYHNGKSYTGDGGNVKVDPTLSIEGQAADAKAVGDAITTMLNKLNESGANVRYNDESDYFEVKKDGEWEQTKIKVGLLKQILFSANNNEASFEASSYSAIGSQGVSPTLTIGETMNAYVSNSTTRTYGTLVSELIDVTNYDKLVVYHKSTNSRSSGIEQNASVEWVKMYVTDSLSSKMTPLASIMLLNGIKTSEGEVTLDLSQVTGNVYIVFELATNAATMTTEISSLYLE